MAAQVDGYWCGMQLATCCARRVIDDGLAVTHGLEVEPLDDYQLVTLDLLRELEVLLVFSVFVHLTLVYRVYLLEP